MRLKYLGTGAGECVPGFFCDCPTCTRSAALGGRNIRTRFQALIDNKLLIDFGPDTYSHIIQNKLKLWEIQTCLITHDHTDHLRAEDFELRRHKIAHFNGERPLQVYGTAPAGNKIRPIISEHHLDEQNRVFFHEIIPFQTFQSDGYTITPLKAEHNPKCDPVMYLIQHNGKSILLAHDTGVFPEESWSYLSSCGIVFDLISYDCTGGVETDSGGRHMSLPINLDVRHRLEKLGVVSSQTKHCLSHFSHNGHAVYDDFVPIAEKEGFLVSYDGMEIFI
ncbi:hypothetical protein LJC63_01255 [Ruminococcaceae bacterium OttesenSCG-928-L11]|nr:hypothetical protein [Ruminococcaceae bacterium OttesenSCG-928-L11]